MINRLSALSRKFNEYFSRWNPDKDRPRGGRGIENPWKKQVGRILQAYYDKEAVREDYERACEVEADIDRAVEVISRAVASLRE